MRSDLEQFIEKYPGLTEQLINRTKEETLLEVLKICKPAFIGQDKTDGYRPPNYYWFWKYDIDKMLKDTRGY